MNSSVDPSPSPEKQQSWIKLGATVAIIAALGVLLWKFGPVIQDKFTMVLSTLEDLGPRGPIFFIGIYILSTVLFLPASILTLGAGVVFGVLAGALYVIIGATIGANLAFLIGRYLARDRISQMMSGNKSFQAIDRAIGKEGWKIVGLIRLSPAFPFNVLNYALGLTQVSFGDNLIGTFGIIPGTFMYVYIGSLAGDLAMVAAGEQPANNQAEIAQWVIRIVGFIATVGVTVYVTRVARKALKESVEPTP
jgi:uncharacterized membrane protein YdjX (TVP38/TMEM64 family)